MAVCHTVGSGIELLFFFFQAEDGIRDGHVTGVQTCALPIYAKHYNLEMIIAIGYRARSHRGTQFRQWATERLNEYLVKGRSEERRVGKECRARWGRAQ